ncbi:MAG: MarC family protein [Thermodesulfovibrionales bacterium]|nr:MarC family protein [Thermodesulfovibrionales bacterium]
MENIIKTLPNTFIPLFVAIDVLVALSIFVSLTEEMSKSERKTIIKESILTALIVSLLFVALGEAIFTILGITSDDFKIAGGLVLLIFAVSDLIRPGEERRKPVGRVGVVPIGVPLIVGPAVLTTILVLVDHYGIIPTIISLILNLLVVWISFINAERIMNLFGKGGIAAISKIMALLLASIAIMMIRLGVSNIVHRYVS